MNVQSDSTLMVRTRDGSAIMQHRALLYELGSVELLPTYTDRCLLAVGQRDEDPRATWQRVQEYLGEGFEVEPVFLDDAGFQRLPLGTITVRFKGVPTDDDLASLARAWDLEVKNRNKYVPSQVTFQTVGPQYLPERLKSISETDAGVEQVWPDVLSHFKRE